jgi:hypothetical protein
MDHTAAIKVLPNVAKPFVTARHPTHRQGCRLILAGSSPSIPVLPLLFLSSTHIAAAVHLGRRQTCFLS